ncbi:hypothetical protein [Haloplanus halophilus]|uniref:hypothetical protein n=1 Tax=Haloplanus halophilus TaxID=2949993 RepID=UPI00203BE236|nr:hypothetical protein [Haloplanus sp. GDY1]
MSARSSLPSAAPSTVDRIGPLVDALAVLAGGVGALLLLGDRGPLPAAVERLRSLTAVAGAPTSPVAPLAQPVAWATLLLCLSAVAAYALWTRRRWLVWTLAGVAGVVAILGVTAGGLSFAPLAALLSLAAGLRSFRAGRATVEQQDVTLR